MSLSKVIFPDDLMLAVVTYIYKAGDPQLFGNYRPISVLPAFSKILEKIVITQLTEYFIKNGLFSPQQLGFLPGVSTADAKLNIVNCIYDSLDRGEVPWVCF